MTKTLKYFCCVSAFEMENNFIVNLLFKFKFSLVNIISIVLVTAN